MPTFEITKVDTEHQTWTAKKGPAAGQEFHSYKITAKGPDGELRDFEINRKPSSGPPPLGAVEAEVQPSNGSFPDKLKLTPQGRGGGGSGAKDEYWQAKEQRDIESQARMGRAHAQEMALRREANNIASGKKERWNAEQLAKEIDWFHQDVQRFPLDADGGGSDMLNKQKSPPDAEEPAAAVSARVGFASDKQKGFFERLLKNAGLDSNQVAAILRFTEQLPTERVSKAIDGLNDAELKDQTVAALLRESDAWARLQSDVPWSDDE